MPAGPYDYQVPIPEEIKERLNDIGRTIGRDLPKGWGFTLLIFNFGPGGAMTYISNAERSTMREALREMVKKFEGDS